MSSILALSGPLTPFSGVRSKYLKSPHFGHKTDKKDTFISELGHPDCPPAPTTRWQHFKLGLKNTLMIPVLPLIGYYGLDATGVRDYTAGNSVAMKNILGEGFGHAGLCFSLHYVINAGKHFWRAARGDKKQTPLKEVCCK